MALKQLRAEVAWVWVALPPPVRVLIALLVVLFVVPLAALLTLGALVLIPLWVCYELVYGWLSGE